MANTSNQQQAAPTMEQTLTQSEAFFLKYKKAIITVVVALVVIIAGAVLYKTYISEPNEQKASTAILLRASSSRLSMATALTSRVSLSSPTNIAAQLPVTWLISMPVSATLSLVSGTLP